MRLAADQLVTFLDRQYIFDGFWEFRDESLQVRVREFVADGAHDRARHAAHDVRFVAELADFLEHSGFLFLRDAGFENDDHNRYCAATLAGTKKPQARPAAV